MRNYISIFGLVFILTTNGLLAQEFNTDQQYNQAMANAKQAFEAKQYSEAVMFYREAIKIKPDALLPKYKIEDIRTIYIAKELDAQKIEPQVKTEPVKKKKKKKELEVERIVLEEKAKEVATAKMNADADKAEKELRQAFVQVVDIDEDIDSNEIGNSPQVDNIAGDKEVLVKKVESKQQHNIDGGIKNSEDNSLKIEKRDVPVLEEKKIVTEPAVIREEKTEPKKEVKVIPQPEKPKTMSAAEKEQWVIQEKNKLKVTYPNKKTVEEIDKPGKHITRVIMNINNEITIYLKVKHSWGATYFFIDEVGQELKSINEQYFNLMTNLDTYGG